MRCDLCLLYRPNVEKNDRRAEICAVFGKISRGWTIDPAAAICAGCCADTPDAVLFSPECEARKCVIEKGLEHCGYCGCWPYSIFPAEPTHEELVQKIDIEHQWTWEDEKLMEAYDCRKNMDAFRKTKSDRSKLNA